MAFLMMLLGILPGLVWILFYLQEDPHPEPKHLILLSFVVGGLMAVPVFVIQLLTKDLLDFLNIRNVIVLIIVLALIEEFFKFTAAFWVTNKNSEFNEPIDAMIYLITAALGFATIENILFIGHALKTVSLTTAFSTAALRFIGATLLHALASGLMGYYWAIGIIKKSLLKNIIYGLFLAGLIHSVFNYLISEFQSANFILPSLFLILSAVFVLINFEKLRKMV
ncbi:MAG: PrsW family glutamic-type intramembrane protease [Patescibacteria group bacterium]